jgi:hypothetical protein
VAVISDGLSISRAAEKVGVSRQTLHARVAVFSRPDHFGLAPLWQ